MHLKLFLPTDFIITYLYNVEMKMKYNLFYDKLFCRKGKGGWPAVMWSPAHAPYSLHLSLAHSSLSPYCNGNGDGDNVTTLDGDGNDL